MNNDILETVGHIDLNKVKFSLSFDEQYWMVRKNAGYFLRENGLLRLEGNESLELLHRISTNSLSDLSLNNARCTVLTTEKAKIVDLIVVVPQSDCLLLLTSDGNATRVKEWIEKFIITEDIQVKDVTGEISCLSIIGSRASDHFGEIRDNFFPERQEGGHNPSRDILAVFESSEGYLSTYNVVVNSLKLQEIVSRLGKRILSISPDLFDTLRIEYGIAVYGKEMSEHVNPLEAGLESYVSFTKGCYVGQEVIARIDSYKKLQKKVMGFFIDTMDKAPNSLSGNKVFNGDREVGMITSDTWSIAMDRKVALGFITTNVDGGSSVLIGSTVSHSVQGKVVKLPFDI